MEPDTHQLGAQDDPASAFSALRGEVSLLRRNRFDVRICNSNPYGVT